jgi:tetratricopeptide (TPR) repeat protein
MLGDKPAATADRRRGLELEPAADDDRSWIARGMRRIAADADGALEDFRRAERINPRSFVALQNQAHVLTEHKKRPEEALAVTNRLLDFYPDLPEARAGRAVLLARLGRHAEARADADWVKANVADPVMIYQVAGVYSLTGDTREAFRLLAVALTRGVGFKDLPTDPELDPLRGRPEFQNLLTAVRTLQHFLGPAEQP